MTKYSPAEEAYWTAKQKVMRGYQTKVGAPAIVMVESAYDELVAQVERAIELEKILEFYADPKNYDPREGLAIMKDCGDKAREGIR